MIITPKDWGEFQHYKDRNPAWIKLHKRLLDNYEFYCLPLASQVLAPRLWLLASEYNEGRIEASEGKLLFRLHMNKKEFYEALHPLVEALFFEVTDDASDALADGYQNAIPRREEKRTRIEEKNICNLEFEKFKRAYPKRKGGQGWPDAQKHFEKAVKSGIEPSQLITAAEKFAKSVESAVGTEFVPMAEKWVRKQLYLEFIPSQEDIERARKAEEFLASRGYGQPTEPN